MGIFCFNLLLNEIKAQKFSSFENGRQQNLNPSYLKVLLIFNIGMFFFYLDDFFAFIIFNYHSFVFLSLFERKSYFKQVFRIVLEFPHR